MQHLHACTHAHAPSTQASKQLKHARQRTPATRTPSLAVDPAAAASPHTRHIGLATGPHAAPGTMPSRPPPSLVARDHAQHSATPTPCRTRRITADRRASRCRPPARRSAPAAPRTRSYSVVKTQRPRRPLPGLVASAVKHSAAPGRTCSAAPPTPAYKRRSRALHSGHPVLATARKSPRSRSALTTALSSLSSSSL